MRFRRMQRRVGIRIEHFHRARRDRHVFDVNQSRYGWWVFVKGPDGKCFNSLWDEYGCKAFPSSVEAMNFAGEWNPWTVAGRG